MKKVEKADDRVGGQRNCFVEIARALGRKQYSGSPGRTRTYNLAVNSRPLYQLSYRGGP